MPPSKVRKNSRRSIARKPAKKAASKAGSSPYSLAQVSGEPLLQLSPLDVQVPEFADPSTVPEVRMDYDYQWQNPTMLATMYERDVTAGNERLNALRQFLYLMKELETRGLADETGPDLTKDQIRELVAIDRGKLEAQLAQLLKSREQRDTLKGTLKESLKALQTQKQEARGEHREAMKDKRARIVNRIKVSNEKAIKYIKETNLVKVEKNLAWAEKKKNAWTQEEYDKSVSMWTTRKKRWLDKIAEREGNIAEIIDDYNRLVAPSVLKLKQIQMEIDDHTDQLKELRQDEKASKSQEKELNKELSAIKKIEGGDSDSVKAWKRAKIRRELSDMDQDQLIDEIQKLFATDPRGERFPPWIRYAVFHFSGVIYDSAHSDWSDPRKMLTVLKDEEFASMSSNEDRRMMQARGLEALSQNPSLSHIPNRIRKRLKRRFNSTSLKDKKWIKGKDRALMEQIFAAEEANSLLYLELKGVIGDDDKTYELMMAIESQEEAIENLEAQLSEKAGAVIKNARDDRAKVLQDIFQEDAKAKLRQLNDGQALQILSQMYIMGQIPEPVWQEIQVFTQLRINVKDENWIEVKRAQGLKGVKGNTPEEERELKKWREVMTKKGFHSHFTSWRAHHAETLDPSIASEMKCDQLGSMVQHLRGHKRDGGLRKNMRYYKEQAEKGNTAAYLKNPETLEDLKVGASLYKLGWTQNNASKEGEKYQHALDNRKGRFKSKEREVNRLIAKRDKKRPRGKRKGEYLYNQNKRDEIQADIDKLMPELNKRREEYENWLAQEADVAKFDPMLDKQPDYSQVISPTSHTGNTAIIGALSIQLNAQSDGWTYKVIRDSRYHNQPVIMRARPNPAKCKGGNCLEFSTERNPEVLKQYLRITHEATIYHADNIVTLTFDTYSKFDGQEVKGMGFAKQLTKDILGNPRIWIGYAPDQYDPDLISPYLLDSVVTNQSVSP